MAQWGSNDQSNNSPLWAVAQVNKTPNTANRDALFQNSTSNGYVSGQTIGVFGVSDVEQASRGAAHTGWVLRKVGQGGRSGRVQTEVLVAGGIVTASGDTTFGNPILIIIDSAPSSKSVNATANAITTFAVTAHGNPAANLSYQWQYKAANGTYINVTANATYSNVTTSTLYIANVSGLTNTYYQVFVSTSGANTVTAGPVVLTVTT